MASEKPDLEYSYCGRYAGLTRAPTSSASAFSTAYCSSAECTRDVIGVISSIEPCFHG
jgi:hypothetical protein